MAESNNITGVGTTAANIPWDPKSTVNANHVIVANTLGGAFDKLAAAYDSSLKHDLMMGLLDTKNLEITKGAELQGKVVDLQVSLNSSNERIAMKQLTTLKEIKEIEVGGQNVAVKAKADAAVKIAKINALNSQFYGQPNSLPNWNS